jgi:hypothetical protein
MERACIRRHALIITGVSWCWLTLLLGSPRAQTCDELARRRSPPDWVTLSSPASFSLLSHQRLVTDDRRMCPRRLASSAAARE